MNSSLEVGTQDLIERAVCSLGDTWITIGKDLIQQTAWNFSVEKTCFYEVGGFIEIITLLSSREDTGCFLLTKEGKTNELPLSLFKIQLLIEKPAPVLLKAGPSENLVRRPIIRFGIAAFHDCTVQ